MIVRTAFAVIIMSRVACIVTQCGASRHSRIVGIAIHRLFTHSLFADSFMSSCTKIIQTLCCLGTAILLLSPAVLAQTPPAAEHAPVVISLDEAGNLILQSSDPAALDRLEEIMQANRPPRRPYDIFKVEHARASWIKLNLDEYFEDEDARKDNDWSYYFYGYDERNNQDKSRQLGDKPPIRFIADNDTNSIVVQGADDIARQTIKELIKLWDVPEPSTTDEDARFTRLVKIQYSRADSIANTIKEAYRDLLSANDKTFQAPGGDESKREGSSSSNVGASGGLSFVFKGKLSLGVDAVTNSILISAEGKPLLELVCSMVEELDVAARREGDFEVYQLDPTVSGKSVRTALAALFNTPRQQQQKEQKQNQPQPEGEAVVNQQPEQPQSRSSRKR